MNIKVFINKGDYMKKRKGLSLIEVLVSMAILGVIALLAMSMFGFGVKNIISSGKRTEEVYDLEGEINEIIFGNPDNVQGEEISIEVKIPGLSVDKYIEGKIYTIKQNNNRIKTFVPDK